MIVEYAFECLTADLRTFIVGASQEQGEVRYDIQNTNIGEFGIM